MAKPTRKERKSGKNKERSDNRKEQRTGSTGQQEKERHKNTQEGKSDRAVRGWTNNVGQFLPSGCCMFVVGRRDRDCGLQGRTRHREGTNLIECL